MCEKTSATLFAAILSRLYWPVSVWDFCSPDAAVLIADRRKKKGMNHQQSSNSRMAQL
jgi:hypothetical protein